MGCGIVEAWIWNSGYSVWNVIGVGGQKVVAGYLLGRCDGGSGAGSLRICIVVYVGEGFRDCGWG